jgi:hypothetical protein
MAALSAKKAKKEKSKENGHTTEESLSQSFSSPHPAKNPLKVLANGHGADNSLHVSPSPAKKSKKQQLAENGHSMEIPAEKDHSDHDQHNLDSLASHQDQLTKDEKRKKKEEKREKKKRKKEERAAAKTGDPKQFSASIVRTARKRMLVSVPFFATFLIRC